MYFEASGVEPGYEARMLSPAVDTLSNGGQYCLTFWYHMWGEDIGGLNVSTVLDSGTPILVWTRTMEAEGERLQRLAVMLKLRLAVYLYYKIHIHVIKNLNLDLLVTDRLLPRVVQITAWMSGG